MLTSFPSPHIGVHLPDIPFIWMQFQPTSIVLQSSEQPSPAPLIPLSQTSPRFVSTIEFPHRFIHIEGSPVQTKPDSIVQVALHPSPEIVFPSSHF